MAAIEFNTERLAALVADRMIVGGLSEAGRGLAFTLSSESAQMISDLAASLPEFHRDTYAEVLKREGEIISRLDKVFDEIEKIRNTVAKDSPNVANTIYEQSYRRSVARELDKIELFGLDTGIRQSSRQHSLSTAYISLSVSGANEMDEGDFDADDHAVEKRSSLSVRAEEAANSSQLVLIKGEAGSGKTTLLQSFAVRCATASYVEEMEHWNDLIPFFVRLRALSGKTLPTPEELPSLVAPMISSLMPRNWAFDQLKSGRGLVLVDGLDEVTSERRDETRRWIDTLVSEFPETRVIITSRPTAVGESWLSQKGFRQLELLTMSPDDVSVFIDHWHDAVAVEEQNSRKRDVVHLLVPELKERIRTDRALRELAATPLLCAMLCAMNRDRNQVLPTNRIALYEAAVQTILHGRDEERRIRSDASLRIDFETKSAIIQEIAFWMMHNAELMADQWRVEDFISSVMRNFTKLPSGISSKDILSTLILRSGVLRSPIDGKVDFVHNAFKEYLCAKAVTTGDRFGYLGTMLNNEAWREVAVLAAAMTDDIRRSKFIREVLEFGDKYGDARATYHLLAVRCLETCTQLDPEIQTGIKERLQRLSAPVSLTEARSLSAAGEMALPLLRKGNHYARTAAACVRALRWIGTPEAMDCIKDYAPDQRATVSKEVLSAWPFFDTIEFARSVLSSSYGVNGNIRIDYPAYYAGIKYLRKTRGLIVSTRNIKVPDWAFSDIAGLTSLERLSLFSKGEISISQFLSLRSLSFATFAADTISGLENLNEYSNLYRLNISGKADCPVDLQVLPIHLRHLSLNSLGLELTGVPAKGAFLNTINLVNEKSLNNSTFLGSYPHLNDLTMRNVNSETELASVANCKALQKFTAYTLHDITSLRELSKAESLIELRVNYAEELVDADAIANLKNLRELTLRGAENVENVSFLAHLPKLERLTLDVSESVDLSVLKTLSSLKQLTVSANHADYIRDNLSHLPIRRINSFGGTRASFI